MSSLRMNRSGEPEFDSWWEQFLVKFNLSRVRTLDYWAPSPGNQRVNKKLFDFNNNSFWSDTCDWLFTWCIKIKLLWHYVIIIMQVEIQNPCRQGKKLLVLDIDYTLFDHRSTAENPLQLMRPCIALSTTWLLLSLSFVYLFNYSLHSIYLVV
jgi:hypothetical protein